MRSGKDRGAPEIPARPLKRSHRDAAYSALQPEVAAFSAGFGAGFTVMDDVDMPPVISVRFSGPS